MENSIEVLHDPVMGLSYRIQKALNSKNRANSFVKVFDGEGILKYYINPITRETIKPDEFKMDYQ